MPGATSMDWQVLPVKALLPETVIPFLFAPEMFTIPAEISREKDVSVPVTLKAFQESPRISEAMVTVWSTEEAQLTLTLAVETVIELRLPASALA